MYFGVLKDLRRLVPAEEVAGLALLVRWRLRHKTLTSRHEVGDMRANKPRIERFGGPGRQHDEESVDSSNGEGGTRGRRGGNVSISVLIEQNGRGKRRMRPLRYSEGEA